MTQQKAYIKYHSLETHEGKNTPYRIASIVLNQPERANAFCGDMLVDIQELLVKVRDDKSIRMLLFQGAGKNFSAGADLRWMKKTANMSYEDNVAKADTGTHAVT